MTAEVLDMFLGIPEALVHGFDRKEFNRYLHGYYHEQELTVSNIAKFFHNLKQRGYIEVEKINERESVRFTTKARLAIVERLGQRAKIGRRYLLFSFDIPERMATQRDKYRRVLKRLGCKQIQKSLWVSNRDIGELAELAAKEYGVDDYVICAVVDSIDIQTTVDKMFAEDKKN